MLAENYCEEDVRPPRGKVDDRVAAASTTLEQRHLDLFSITLLEPVLGEPGALSTTECHGSACGNRDAATSVASRTLRICFRSDLPVVGEAVRVALFFRGDQQLRLLV